ncbi:hypothetical protein [Azospirillum largimobile]
MSQFAVIACLCRCRLFPPSPVHEVKRNLWSMADISHDNPPPPMLPAR